MSTVHGIAKSHTRLSGYITTMNSIKDMMFRVIYTYAQMPAPLLFAFVTVGKLLKKSVTSVSLLVKLIYQKYIFRMLQKSYGSLKENFRTRRTTVKFVF